jgi:hypothetical protein
LAVRGEVVKLIAKGISCENDTADFTIKEDALLANQAVQNPPPQVNFSNDKAEVVWTAEFRDNFTKDPNYYFTVFAYNTSISSKNQTNGTLTVIRSNDLDNDSVTNDKDCNDYNASVGECKGCVICSDAKGISGACILGNCSKVKCAESLCGGGTCKSDELAVYPDIVESTCKIINGTGVCMAGNCTFQCKKYDACLKDSDNDSVTDANDKCSNTTTKSVNIFGCPLPKYEKFRNEITTNFSKVDLLQATNVVIGIPGVGMLEFKSNSMNLVGKNLDDYIDIQQNKISVNTAPLPELNVPAVVTLYNINYKKPIIVLDNVYCDSCKFISYDNGIFKFLAQHFSTYSLADWDSYVGFCGDKFCSSSETCASCYQDCGTCPKPPDIIPEKCTESWSCGEWSGCEEGETAKRACSDLNNCGTTLNKPQETISCTELRLQQLQKYNFMIIMGVIILLFTVSYEISGRLKKRSFREHETPELSFWVEKYLTEGYDKVKIKELLSSKGYSKKEIENAMKKAKKDVLF